MTLVGRIDAAALALWAGVVAPARAAQVPPVVSDDTAGGPLQGYDHNRSFLTTLRQLSPAVTFEGGYMWQHAPATAIRPARQGHTLFSRFTYAPPR